MDFKTRRYLARRRVFERVIAAMLLAALWPVLAIVAVCIFSRMGRPIFFCQQRVGHLGKPFNIIKFRTMIPNAEQIGGGYIANELDLIPPLGQFLRSTSLDELPQLINIVRGQMSFVGPRPALPQQYARYTPEQARRVTVPQGITGLAQVTYRNNASWTRRIQKDLEYIDSASLGADVMILIKTIKRVLHSDGILNNQTAAEVDDLGPRN